MSELASSYSDPSPEAPVTATVGGRRTSTLRRLLREPLGVGAIVILLLMTLLSVFAPLLTSADPLEPSLAHVYSSPGENGFVLGADAAGRDVLSRLLHGGRASLSGAVLSLMVALVLGVPLGLLAGFYRGWVDTITRWFAEVFMSLPAIVVLLALMAAVRPSIQLVMAAFGFFLAPAIYRLTRGSVVAVREELYVDAAQVSGLGDGRIILRHILPVVRAPTIIQASVLFGIGILVQATLEFLGFGSPRTPSWGGMLNEAFGAIHLAPHLIWWPGIAISLTVGAFAILGNALRDALEDGGSVASDRVDARPNDQDAIDPDGLAKSVPALAPSDEQLLEVRSMTVSYPGSGLGRQVVVDGVTLGVDHGEVLGLVGESGSGKTQTIFSLLGLLPSQAKLELGALAFEGRELAVSNGGSRSDLIGRSIAYVPQEPLSNLDPSFKIGSQLAVPMRRHLGLTRSQAHERAVELLHRVGLPDPERVMRSYPHQLSGGMAQRVLIAGAVSCDPKLLLADEPTTALDVTVQAEILDVLRSLQQERQMGMILVTHDFGIVADICDRVAVMQHGRIVEASATSQLFADPQHPYTRMLLASTLEDAEPRSHPSATPDPAREVHRE